MLRSAAPALLLCASLVSACGSRGPRGASAASERSQAATGAINGIVRDGPTSTPLSFVTVTATRPGADPASVSTGSDGHYRLSGLRAGRYNVIFYYAQRTEQRHSVSVRVRGTTRLDLSFGSGHGPGAAPVAAAGGASIRGVSKRRAATGGIEGAIVDGQTKQRLPGAVVAATTPNAVDAVLAIADDTGRYHLPSLVPGTYVLSVYYHLSDRGNIEVRRSGVKVRRGELIEIDLVLDVQPEL